jgi:glycerol uptake facilitator-like aquaporin
LREREETKKKKKKKTDGERKKTKKPHKTSKTETKKGHLNPAITVGALVANKISCMRAVAYVFMQIAGAIVGTAFVWTIDSVGPAANVLSPTGRVGHAGAFTVEFLLTFALMWVTLAATDASRYRSVSHLPILAPLAIGMTYFIAHMAAIPIDGCSINPARFLGTFTLSGVGGWAMWVFFVAPFTGAIAAAFVYELGFKPDYDGLIDLEGGASAAAAPAAVAPAK